MGKLIEQGRSTAAKMRELLDAQDTADQGTLLIEMTRAFGGAKAVCREIVNLFRNTTSPLCKQKILTLYVDLVKSTTARELAQNFDPTLVSDDDLACLAARFTQLARLAAKGDADGDGAGRSESEPSGTQGQGTSGDGYLEQAAADEDAATLAEAGS